MTIDNVIAMLDEHDEVSESYVLLREIKLHLNVGANLFHPELGIKIYKSSVIADAPYHFDVSHNVHSPEQASPYYSSRTSHASEREAIRQAISSITVYIQSAIQAGHSPNESWMVKNEFF